MLPEIRRVALHADTWASNSFQWRMRAISTSFVLVAVPHCIFVRESSFMMADLMLGNAMSHREAEVASANIIPVIVRFQGVRRAFDNQCFYAIGGIVRRKCCVEINGCGLTQVFTIQLRDYWEL